MIAKVPRQFHSGEYRLMIKDSQPQERGLAVVRTVAELRKAVSAFRTAGHTVGLVPTMGALHEGHVSLVKGALERGDVPVTSIFVNPTQFGPKEDFSAYPRDEEGDFDKLRDGGFDIVEYFTVVDAESLKPLEHVAGPARVIAAARLGRTRLIDNLAV